MNPSFLETLPPAAGEDLNLAHLEKLVSAFERLMADAEELEQRLKEKQAAMAVIGGTEIPTFLQMAGLSEIKLASGKKVIVKQDVSVSVKDHPAFLAWLKSRGEDEICKLSVDFERMPTEKRDQLFITLAASGVDYSADDKVHSATMKKYFKELLGIGKDPEAIAAGLASGEIKQPADVAGFASVFTYNKTTIK